MARCKFAAASQSVAEVDLTKIASLTCPMSHPLTDWPSTSSSMSSTLMPDGAAGPPGTSPDTMRAPSTLYRGTTQGVSSSRQEPGLFFPNVVLVSWVEVQKMGPGVHVTPGHCGAMQCLLCRHTRRLETGIERGPGIIGDVPPER